MIILAIDPGRTTGICAIRTMEGKKGFVVVTALEIPWENRLELLSALIDGTYFDSKIPQPPEAVIIENFRLRQGRALEQSGSDFPSSQLIGMVHAFLWMDKRIVKEGVPQSVADFIADNPQNFRPYGLERLHYQEPATMSNVKIEEDDQPLLTGSEHKKDAYKHARFYYLAHIREWK